MCLGSMKNKQRAGKMTLLKYVTYFVFVTVCNGINADNLKLTQVVILSRHNIRTPLTENLDSYTPNKWPKWVEPVSHLTAKGAVMEGYMGEYFFAWLNKEGLLHHRCPIEGEVFIYANTKERTRETAKAFANSAFTYCNVTVYSKNTTEMDPIFNPIVHNTTEEFKNIVIEEIKRKLNETDLTDLYLELENIIDYKKSENCLEKHLCSFIDDENYISYEVGLEPYVLGPFFIGNSIVDAFTMSYYNGMPLKDIGWGKITKPEQWAFITKFIGINQDIRFNSTYAAKDYAWPFINYMTNIFTSKNQTPFTLLVGHDSNLNTITAALSFKSFDLPGQYESFPIGGKVVFQKWTDKDGEDYLKVEYVYQKWVDIRNSVRPTLDNPPQRVTLEINSCKTDVTGLCSWRDFVNILKEFA